MLRTAGIVCAFLVLPATAALASGSEPRAAQDPDEIQCKYLRVVDSKIPQKICRTKFEWEQERQAQIEERRSSRSFSSRCREDQGPC